MKKLTKEEREQFVKEHFYKCDKCGYQNEKGRYKYYGICLKCGKNFKDQFKNKLSNMLNIN